MPTIVAVDADGEVFRLMSESAHWVWRDEGGHALRRILDAAPQSRKGYILELRDELKTFVCAFAADHECI